MELDERIAFLKTKANDEGLQLPDDVAWYLAAFTVKDSDLHGSLIRLIAYASLMGQDDLSISLAEDVLSQKDGRVQ